MKKYLMIFALTMGMAGAANAQVADSSAVVNNNVTEELTLTKEVYPQQQEDGDMYHGLSRKLTFDRMIPPHGLEVTYAYPLSFGSALCGLGVAQSDCGQG